MFHKLSYAAIVLFFAAASQVMAVPQVNECIVGLGNACIPGLSSPVLCCAQSRSCVDVIGKGFVRFWPY